MRDAPVVDRKERTSRLPFGEEDVRFADMNRRRRPVFLILPMLLALLVFAPGCATTQGDMNLAGIIEVENDSWAQSDPTTLDVSTDELGENERPSGRKVSLLWGLITFTDY